MKKKLLIPAFLLISLFVNAQSFVLNLEINNLNFSESNRTLITNTGATSSGIAGTAQGSVHRYDNLIIMDGISLSAYLTIEVVSNANIALFDDDSGAPAERFSPQIGAGTGGGYVKYKLNFFDKLTGFPVYLWNYYITAVDIDGSSSSNREYAEFGGYTSYTLSNSTQLTVSSASGMTRFLGITSSLPGVTFDNTASVIANYTTANNEITFSLGQTGNNTSSPRQYSVQLGAQGGTFTNPNTVANPAPVAVSDYGSHIIPASGGVAVANVLSNDIYNGTILTPSQFTLSQVSSSSPKITLNTSTGAVSVAAGTTAGTYTLIYKIALNAAPANFDEGTVTLVVNTPPVVADIPKSGSEDGTITFSQSDFTSKFTDTDGHSLSKINVVSLPANGTLKLSGTAITAGQQILLADLPNITFIPNANWNGSTSFDWNGYDGYDYATINEQVNINITAVNDAPVITVPGAQTTNEDTSITFSSGNSKLISIADTDGDNQTVTVSVQNGTLSLSGVTGLSFTTGDGASDATMTFSGTLSAINTALNGLVYTPTSNYNGGPSILTVSTNDGHSGTDNKTVSITVTAVNDVPVSVADSKTTTANTPVSLNVTTNDTDADGNNTIDVATVDLDPSTIGRQTTFTVTGEGTYTVDNTGLVTFTPLATFTGTATPINYTVKDNSAATSNSTTITITVTPAANISIIKTIDNESPLVGSSVTFTLVATNNGPSAATGVTVTDILPAGYTYVSTSPTTGVSYNSSTNTLTWSIGNLASSASSTLTVIATVNP